MSKRQEMREKRKRKQRLNRLAAIGLIALGAITVVSLFVWSQYRPIGTVVVPTPDPRPQADFNNMGDPNAPVKIVEYADFQCPFCARFRDQTEELLVENYVKAGTVYFTYRSFGNFVSDKAGGGNSESEDAAAAAYCAGDQDKFWEYYDILYANQNGENIGDFSPRRLEAFADELGLDAEAFASCMDSNKYADDVRQDALDGIAAITGAPNYDPTEGYGTPTFFVNGVLISGAQPYETFQQAIEAALATAAP
jgi:protein-disulfide isomerase